ncbi:DISARM system phospholipase D-like protein DrmC [Frankia tisae]|uniref:DISARM system phospholipase D-like protein DrmC n=1 Tax=Frankia tisae TaxID=2950104 RepID=UPI0021BF9C46|nr:DISARM system phospholipase D-like protein DrmC [Frankia tisae]
MAPSEPGRVGDFAAAVADAVSILGPARLGELADRIGPRPAPPGAAVGEPGWEETVIAAVAGPAARDAVRAVLRARRAEEIALAEAAAYLHGVSAGYAGRAAETRVESVWSGPSSREVPVRATARVLMDLVSEATMELMLMTYAARPYPPLLTALSAATERGVAVSVVVETLQGAGGGLAGSEPAAAFASVRGVQLWHWPTGRRGHPGARMHAKIAVADRRALLVSSANLTSSGVEENIEAGLLVRGGAPPRRAAEHLAALQTSGVLARLLPGTEPAAGS